MIFYPKKISSLLILFTTLITISYSSPLSSCNQGYFSYVKDSNINSNTCNLSPLSDAYPASVNSDFFKVAEKCGICYEMVGPFGAVKIRVEDSFTDNNENDNSFPYFKLGSNSSLILLGLNDINDLNENKKITISFRMISCDINDKINILTGEDNNEGFIFSALVLNNNIAISGIRMKENGGDKYLKLERDSKNFWSYDKQDFISYPVNIAIVSITGEIVNVTAISKESEEIFQGDGNFINNDSTIFKYDTLKKDKDINSLENCCSYDYSDFSIIYNNCVLNTNYEISNELSNYTLNNSDSLFEINFQNNGKIIIKSLMPIRADQFLTFSLLLKSSTICSDCLYISSYNKNKDIKIQIKNTDLNNYQYTLEQLGVENNTFNGIILYAKDNSINITLGKIELIKNSDPPSSEICLGNKTDWIPYVPPIETTIETTNIIQNNTNTIIEKSDINILNISLINSTSIFILSSNFAKIENEILKLIFISDNSYNFETTNCLIDTNKTSIESFNCIIPNISTIQNGNYTVSCPNNSLYQIISTKKVLINDSNLFYDYSPKIDPIPIPNPIDSTNVINPNIFYDIIITNSITKVVTKGENITFQINPMDYRDYNFYGIDEMILLDNNTGNTLYLKDCTGISSNNITNAISCKVSNNIIKGNYTTLADGQYISIEEGKMISLICTSSNGGYISVDMNQTIDANISKYKKRNYTINLNVSYYDQNLSPKDLFPYTVKLWGKLKSNNLRYLPYDPNYNSEIEFPNCTLGAYSSQNEGEMNGIICNLPDFIPAGKYTKLKSDGFDVNPNSKINFNFPYDFNKSENYIPNENITIIRKAESSKSKTWIVWLILGILTAVLVVIIIFAFCVNKNRKEKENNAEANESRANQINNDNNQNNNNQSNSISQSA